MDECVKGWGCLSYSRPSIWPWPLPKQKKKSLTPCYCLLHSISTVTWGYRGHIVCFFLAKAKWSFQSALSFIGHWLQSQMFVHAIRRLCSVLYPKEDPCCCQGQMKNIGGKLAEISGDNMHPTGNLDSWDGNELASQKNSPYKLLSFPSFLPSLLPFFKTSRFPTFFIVLLSHFLSFYLTTPFKLTSFQSISCSNTMPSTMSHGHFRTQQVKALAAKPADLDSIPGTLIMEEENQPCNWSSDHTK